MKEIILFLLLAANFIACKQNTNSIDKKTEKEEFIVTNSEKELLFYCKEKFKQLWNNKNIGKTKWTGKL